MTRWDHVWVGALLVTAVAGCATGAPRGVTITSMPSGADIHVDGVTRAQTRATLALTPDRSYDVILSKPGYQSAAVRLEPEPVLGGLVGLFLGPGNNRLVPAHVAVRLEDALPPAPAPAPAGQTPPSPATVLAAVPPTPVSLVGEWQGSHSSKLTLHDMTVVEFSQDGSVLKWTMRRAGTIGGRGAVLEGSGTAMAGDGSSLRLEGAYDRSTLPVFEGKPLRYVLTRAGDTLTGTEIDPSGAVVSTIQLRKVR